MRESDKKIALVDFDGTLINADSFKTALLTSVSPSFFFRLLKVLTGNISTIHKISFSRLKEMLTEAMYSGMSTGDFEALCIRISANLNKYDNTSLLDELKGLKKLGYEVYIVTASPVNWVKPWATKHEFNHVIGTELEVVDKQLTGKFLTQNCKGSEKVTRIASEIDIAGYKEVVAYGNSKDDYPMLALAHRPFWVHKNTIMPWSAPAGSLTA